MTSTTAETVSPLRRRMLDDMAVRNFSPDTQREYVRAVKKLAAFLRRPPDTATAEEVRAFQIHLNDTGTRPPTMNATVTRHLAFVYEPRKLPRVLSPEDVLKLVVSGLSTVTLKKKRRADGTEHCISISGLSIDAAIAEVVLRELRPLGVAAALNAIEAQSSQTTVAERQLELSLQQARYEAAHARRQVIGARAVAVIAAKLAAVVDVQLAPAMATAQQAWREQLARAGRATGDRTGHASGIVSDCFQIPHELVPADVGRVMILDQHIPLGHQLVHPAPDTLAAIDHADAAGRATEGVGAGVDRVGQDIVHDVVGGQSPDDAVRLALRADPDSSRSGRARP